MHTLETLPKFDDLPNKHRFWDWGAPGSHEEGLGKLCLLTPEHVAKSAASEIRTGDRVGLGWEMDKPEFPAFNRQKFKHSIMRGSPMSLDDVYEFNPQQSSQWDGFRHYSQPEEFSLKEEDKGKDHMEHRVFSGNTTAEEIMEQGSTRLGIQHWAQQGIVGRGILLDYARYAEKKGIKYSCFDGTSITYQDLQNVIEYFKVEVRPADMLFVRIGLTKEWESLTEKEKQDYASMERLQFTGLERSDAMKKFIWDNHFTVIAGDAVAVESIKLPQPEMLNLHETVLCGYGVVFGELFNLEKLSELCQKHNRFSFFVSSVPLNAPGGVSSPPNAVAIF